MKIKYNNKIGALLLVVCLMPLLITNGYIVLQLKENVTVFNLSLIIFIESMLLVLGFLLLIKKIPPLFSHDLNLIKASRFDEISNSSLRAIFNEFGQISQSLTNQVVETNQSILKIEKLNHDKLTEISELTRMSRQLENHLGELNKVNMTIFDMVEQFLVICDSEFNIQMANKAILNRLGYQLDQLQNKPFQELIISSKDQNVNYENELEKLKLSTSEPVFLTIKMHSSNPDASEYMSIQSILLANGNYLCIGKAVNDEIALQSNILRKNRELEYINQINSALISNWDITALLDNIIKRIDYLFNISASGIYVNDETNGWLLRAYASKYLTIDEMEQLNISTYFNQQVLGQSKVQVVESNIEGLKYLVLAPLEVDQKIIAILVIASNQEMNNNDLSILRMFKNQASMVIQRALIYDELRKQYLGTIQALVNVIEAKDKYTEGHSRRVSRFAVEMAKEMGYSNEEIENIEIAGLLHDVGKIGIDQEILVKQGKLTEEEYLAMKEHPTKGIQILDSIGLEEPIKEGILYHHLRYDLKGYPKAAINELPKYAGIIGIADAFDAITSARSYSKAKTIEEALNELVRHEGTQFHPEMVSVMKRIIEEAPNRIQVIIDDTII
ncbi:MAG: HD domain-containing protein [Firmicutes bacterium]|nr:HD domain-containing protein [Bacillota bacterium]